MTFQPTEQWPPPSSADDQTIAMFAQELRELLVGRPGPDEADKIARELFYRLSNVLGEHHLTVLRDDQFSHID